MNKIELAVMPLKEDAIKRAEEEVNKIVERVKKELTEAGNDLKVCAPYPSSGMGVQRYHVALSKYKLYNSLCKPRKYSLMLNESNFVDVDPERVNHFLKESKENAAADYDAFVAKLVSKIGLVKEATLTGNHVWSFSILEVVKEDGSKEKWKTQMIVNVSKLGKLFNQWPTRKVK